MATAITAAIVRARWPHLASTTAISDALLAILITEADEGLNPGAGTAFATRREEAVTHYAAHKATVTIGAQNSEGAAVGPVASASFLHRSVSRAVTAVAESNPMAADLATTLPGRTLLTLLNATRRLPGVIS